MRNRAKVLAAARAVFAEHGAEAQMDDVARRAGVGVGTVYRHFETKEALAEALVEAQFDAKIAYVSDLVEHEPDPWRAIERCFMHCGAMQERDRGWAAALGTLASVPTGPRAHQVEQLLALQEVLLQRAREAGVVRPDLVAADMPPFYCGIATIVLAGFPDWRRYVELLLDGLRPRP